MGIPGFFGHWLARVVRRAIVRGLPPFVSSLSMDMNGIFHDAKKVVLGDGSKDPRVQQAVLNTDPAMLELEIFNAIVTIILRTVQFIQPRDCLILAVDGVAPGGKMQQQRGRREKAAQEQSPHESFDRNSITPGTEFMLHLDNYILRFISNYRQYLPPKVIYSSHLVPGEGEHKIMDYYRRGEASDGPAAKQGGSHVLYGLDADLIMLSLLSPLNNIYLSRESVEEVVSIDQVKEHIMEQAMRPSAIHDFVILMFLIGNDFLPHNPALQDMSESIKVLFDIYSRGGYVLTKINEDGHRSINWTGMSQFMQPVAALENGLLAGLSTRAVKHPSRFLQAAVVEGKFYINVFRSTWYQNALGAKGTKGFTEALVQIINEYVDDPQVPGNYLTTISAVTPARIEEMVVSYMRTMEWTYRYYLEGTNAINHHWAYPHYHTPMLSDLAAVMQTVGVTREVTGFQAYEKMVPFTALQQLVAVLPLKSRSLLPEELQPLFSYNSIIRDFFPETFIVELDGKEWDHQAVAIVPLIDRQRVIDAVAQITFTRERAKLWMPAEEQFFVRTEAEEEILLKVQLDQQRHADFLAREAAQAARRQRQTFHAGPSSPGRGAPPGIVPTMSQTAASRGVRTFPARGRGTFVERGRGTFVERGRGTFVERGRGTFVERGRGTFVERGRGTFVERGRGTFVERGRGTFVERGRGTFVERGRGTFVERGRGAFVERGRGAFVERGRGSRDGGTFVQRPATTAQARPPPTQRVLPPIAPAPRPATRVPLPTLSMGRPAGMAPGAQVAPQGPIGRGPTLAPIGATLPPGVVVGRTAGLVGTGARRAQTVQPVQPSQAVQTIQPIQPSQPTQWNRMENLM